MFGRAIHLVVDAVLVSMCLAGVKRNTGLTPSLRRIPNKDARNVVRVWLETGEWLTDFLVVFLGRSSFFERIR